MSELILIYNLEFVEGIIDFIVMSNTEPTTFKMYFQSLYLHTPIFKRMDSYPREHLLSYY